MAGRYWHAGREARYQRRNDVNIFRQDDSCIALTIDEIVAKVVALVEAQAVVEPKQANAQ